MQDKLHTVIIMLEAKADKVKDLLFALEAVAEQSRAEQTNIEYRVHQSIDNPQQFILYENWQSKDKHLLQFEKPYIKDFAEKLDDLLAKPYEAYFANEV